MVASRNRRTGTQTFYRLVPHPKRFGQTGSALTLYAGQRGAGQDLADQSRNGFKKTLKIE
jgi:hypothetical protein